MNHQSQYAYGLWPLVIINSAIFIIFAFSFTHPKTKWDWRSLGAFSAFIIALFTEMYGFPLTIYFLAPWLQSKFPDLKIYSHEAGHLWWAFLGFEGDAHMNPIHLFSNAFIWGGILLLAFAWHHLLKAHKLGILATSGPYNYVRHPQYIAFIMIMFGFLLMWPTILTVLMFPILVYMYFRLALHEERDVRSALGAQYDHYAALVPRFIPRLDSKVYEPEHRVGVRK